MYVIVKRSATLKGKVAHQSDAYRGPACAKAWIEPGQVYFEEADAISDAIALVSVDPTGFRVYEVGKEQPLWQRFGAIVGD